MVNKKISAKKVMQPLEHIQKMANYALADLSAPSGKQPVVLSQNESLRPPSPDAAIAVQQVISGTNFYPDPDWTELRLAIADVHALSPNQILIGAGSMQLISCVVQAYVGPGEQILTTQYAYAFIRTMAQITNADIDLVEEVAHTVSIENILAAVSPETRVVFVANPGNPTSTRISREDILQLRAGLPTSVLLIVDEAYGEFVDQQDSSVFDLLEQGNTVVLRTFSKAYGLAGMRVGWGAFPPGVAKQVRKLLNPNNVNTIAQVAATAVVRDQEYMRDTVVLTNQIRRFFVEKVRALDLLVLESQTNFVLIKFSSIEHAQLTEQYLRSEGILVRGMGGYDLADCLRVTIGTKSQMQRVYECLKDCWSKP